MNILKPMRLCVPADKNDEGIISPRTPLLCYKNRSANPSTVFKGPLVDVFIDNQFGGAVFDVHGQRELCAPAVLNLPPTPTPAFPTKTASTPTPTPLQTSTPTPTATTTP